MSGALTAITAAVVGVVLNLALWFALHTLFAELRPFRMGPVAFDLPRLASVDLPALALTLAAMVAIFRFRLGPLPVLAGCAFAGLAWFALGGDAGGSRLSAPPRHFGVRFDSTRARRDGNSVPSEC